MTLKPMTHLAAVKVACDLSREDRAELLASGQPDFEAVILQSWRMSDFSGCVDLDGRPVAVYGCASLPGMGVPWMLATPDFRLHPRRAMDLSRHVIGQMRQRHARLVNLVHSEHEYASRWLARLGFKIGTEPDGPGGQFRRFEWEKVCATPH